MPVEDNRSEWAPRKRAPGGAYQPGTIAPADQRMTADATRQHRAAYIQQGILVPVDDTDDDAPVDDGPCECPAGTAQWTRAGNRCNRCGRQPAIVITLKSGLTLIRRAAT